MANMTWQNGLFGRLLHCAGSQYARQAIGVIVVVFALGAVPAKTLALSTIVDQSSRDLATLGNTVDDAQPNAPNCAPSPGGSALLTDGLYGYWKLDEASGVRHDVSGHGNDLTDNNNVGQAPGKVGSAAVFAKTAANYLSHVDNADLSTGNIDFTVAAWIKLTSKSPYEAAFVSKYDFDVREYTLNWYSGIDRFRFNVDSTGNGLNGISVIAASFGAPSLNTWNFVVGWHDATGDTVNIQVNNGAVDTACYSLGVTDLGAPLNIGAVGGHDDFLDGAIDEVGFWKRNLSTAERTALYNNGHGQTYPFEVPLETTLSVSTHSAHWGDTLDYVFTARNPSGTITVSPTITDVLPISLQFVNGSAQASHGVPNAVPNGVKWSGVINPGQTLTLTLSGLVSQADTDIEHSVLYRTGPSVLFESATVSTHVDPIQVLLPAVQRAPSCPAPYYDNFDDVDSGWPTTVTSVWSYGYLQGEYQLLNLHAPAVAAATRGDHDLRYTVEVSTRQASSAQGTSGLMFYLNNDFSELYTFEVYAPGQQYAIFHYDHGHWSLLNNGVDPFHIQGGSLPTQIKIEVGPGSSGNDEYSFYIGGASIGFTLQLPPADRRVGVVATSDDTGFDARFDDYTFLALTCHAASSGTMQTDSNSEALFPESVLGRPSLEWPVRAPNLVNSH